VQRRLIAFLLPLAAGAAFLAGTGAALAATTQISGTMANGGCGPTHPVAVSGPSRIEVSVSSTAPSDLVYTQIVGPSGAVVSGSPSFDTPGGGTYGIRVCSYGDGMDEHQISYTGVVGTGPAGQPALPRQSGGVVRPFTALSHTASGRGAIRTHAGLAWLSIRADTSGHALVRLDNAARHLHLRATNGLAAAFGADSVRIAGSGITVVVAKNGTLQRVTIRTPRLSASGTVVRGGFVIS
jgi:hypothetical protein